MLTEACEMGACGNCYKGADQSGGWCDCMCHPINCGPMVCQFPPAIEFQTGDHWTCPRCGTTYIMRQPRKERWWRNWSAPNGHWDLPWDA